MAELERLAHLRRFTWDVLGRCYFISNKLLEFTLVVGEGNCCVSSLCAVNIFGELIVFTLECDLLLKPPLGFSSMCLLHLLGLQNHHLDIVLTDLNLRFRIWIALHLAKWVASWLLNIWRAFIGCQGVLVPHIVLNTVFSPNTQAVLLMLGLWMLELKILGSHDWCAFIFRRLKVLKQQQLVRIFWSLSICSRHMRWDYIQQLFLLNYWIVMMIILVLSRHFEFSVDLFVVLGARNYLNGGANVKMFIRWPTKLLNWVQGILGCTISFWRLMLSCWDCWLKSIWSFTFLDIICNFSGVDCAFSYVRRGFLC